MLFLCSLLIHGLRHSQVLANNLPRVRRLALIETIQAIANSITANNESIEVIEEINRSKSMQALAIALENIKTSPYISQKDFVEAVLQEVEQNIMNCHFHISTKSNPHYKATISANRIESVTNGVADAMLKNDWDRLSQLVKITNITLPIPEQHPRDQFREFRDMVVEMLSSSYKMSSIVDIDRRRSLSQLIYSTNITTISQLIEIIEDFIPTSQIFSTPSQRLDVSNHMLNGRYDQLILPQYLDCEDISCCVILSTVSEMSTKESEELGKLEESKESEKSEKSELSMCVICLEELSANTKTLVCNHTFCAHCIDQWVLESGDCPVCRSPVLSRKLDDCLLPWEY